MSTRNRLSVEDGATSGDDFVVLDDGTRLFREKEVGAWFQDLSSWRPLLAPGEFNGEREKEMRAGRDREAEAVRALAKRSRPCTSPASTTKGSKRSSVADIRERLWPSSSSGRKKG